MKYLDGVSDKEKSKLTDIENFVKDASAEIDLKRIRDMLETVKNFKFELKARIVPENFKILFLQYFHLLMLRMRI